MHLVIGLGVSALTWNTADTSECNVSRWSWNAWTKDKVHFYGIKSAQIILGLKYKVVHLKKLVFRVVSGFFICCILDHANCRQVDFKGERELLQQNGPQGQNYIWIIVSKTCSNFSGELITWLFHFKWRVNEFESFIFYQK